MNALLEATGAQVGDLVVHYAESGCAEWRLVSALERSVSGWSVKAIAIARLAGSQDASAQLVRDEKPDAELGVKLPDNYGFRPFSDIPGYNEWLKSELGRLGWNLRDVDTGLAHPVKAPDLAAALDKKIGALMLSRSADVASGCRLTYRPKARRSDDVRLVLNIEIRSGSFFATCAEIDDYSDDREEFIRINLTKVARDASARRML
jgi:hypothetical protein